MVLKMYTVYDCKSGVYDRPWLSQARGAAIRAIMEAGTDGKSMLSKHPADFTLFEIGEWNEELGLAKMYDAKENLGTVLELVGEPAQGLDRKDDFIERRVQ